MRGTLAFGQHEDRAPTHGYEPTREAAMRPCPKGSRGQSKLPNVRIVLLVHARAMIPYYERERVSSSGHLHHIQRVPSLAVELAEAGHRCPVKDECMRQKSQLVLPCDPGYTAHREAGKRRQETREWLRRRERAIAAPSIVPEKPEEKLRVERQRSHSH